MDVAKVWDTRAEAYKENNEKFSLPPALNLANVIKMEKAENIVEIACGTGAFTVHCLCNLHKARSYISVDLSEGMLKLAEDRKCNAKGINPEIDHKFIVGKAYDLSSIGSGSQDVYVSFLCLHVVSERQRFLKEARRLLKKGGKIGLMVPCREGAIMELFEKNLLEVGSKPLFPDDVWDLGYRDVLIKLLEECGFQVMYCWQDHFSFSYYSDDDIEEQLSHGMLKGALSSLTAEQQSRYRNLVVDDFSNVRKAREPPRIPVISIVAMKNAD